MQISPRTCLLAAALLFWGWQTRFLWLALLLGAAVILGAVSRQRLSFTHREFARLWDVTSLLLAGAAIYQRQTSSISGAVISFLQWLPILLFPLIAAFAFSTATNVPYGTFVFWWRNDSANRRGIDPAYAYFGVCLLSASAGGARDQWFYPLAVGLIAAALWLNKPARLSPARTLVLLAMIGGAGFFLQLRWRDLQTELESKTVHWFAGFFPRPFEDQETHTRLGEIGQLKSSGRVLMHVRAASGTTPPRLLRQVCFNQYQRGTWLGTRRSYSPTPEESPGVWRLGSDAAPSNSISLFAAVPEGRILLPAPAGSARVRGLLSARLERNRFGNIRVWDCSDPLECSVDFNEAVSSELPPDARDLQVPLADHSAAEQIVQQIELRSLPPEQMVARLGDYFAEHFRYTPMLAAPVLSHTNTVSFVTSFLQETRAGHCEYFATAATLVLRAAGIPARYALGYAAVERAGADGAYRIRERHAHSWVLAYVDGRWRDFDPTPAAWPEAELRSSSLLRPLLDRWSELKFNLATMQWFPNVDSRLAWLLFLPAAALSWVIFKRKKRTLRTRSPSLLSRAYAWPGLDSEFFQVEQSLRARGLARRQDETPAVWLARIGQHHAEVHELGSVLDLHYKYRFDPDGISGEERQQLTDGARQWLATQRAAVIRGRKIETRSGPDG